MWSLLNRCTEEILRHFQFTQERYNWHSTPVLTIAVLLSVGLRLCSSVLSCVKQIEKITRWFNTIFSFWILNKQAILTGNRDYSYMHFVFLPRDAMLARYMLWPCLSVCLSSTKTARCRITSSVPHNYSPGIYFSDAKDLREIRPGSTPTGAPNAGGVKRCCGPTVRPSVCPICP